MPVPSTLPVPVVTIGLLLLSNVFMTFAWYGHLKFRATPLMVAILVSWASPSSSTACRCPPTAPDTATTTRPN